MYLILAPACFPYVSHRQVKAQKHQTSSIAGSAERENADTALVPSASDGILDINKS